ASFMSGSQCLEHHNSDGGELLQNRSMNCGLPTPVPTWRGRLEGRMEELILRQCTTKSCSWSIPLRILPLTSRAFANGPTNGSLVGRRHYLLDYDLKARNMSATDYHRQSVVSVFLGTFPSEQAFANYLKESYPDGEDGKATCPLWDDLGIRWFDHDYQDARY